VNSFGLRRRHLGSAIVLASACALQVAGGQETGRRCQNIELVKRSETTALTGVQQPDESFITYAGGGVIMVCRAEGVRLVSDSAEYHQAAEIVYLFGRVRYTEGTTAVDAQRITYWKVDERILAEGSVVARLGNGTTMTGPRADYLRAVPALRARAQLRATDRPHITLVQADTSRAGARSATPPPAREPVRSTARGTGGRGRPPETPGLAGGAQPAGRPDTTVVDANTVFMDGDSLVYASGKVVVTRPDLVATSDSLALDRATERARFIGKPVMRGTGDRAFTLTGAVIDIFSRERKLERVLSRVDAKVVSEEIQLSADTLDLRIREDRLERAFAFGTSRARALSTAQDMTADSIEIHMPGQRIREVRAIGKAYALSNPDSTKIRSSERDWIRGDTIIAVFDSIAAADTTSKPRIRELRSLVSARSFYQVASDDSTGNCPKINYSRGEQITVAFDSQAVRRVSVQDSVNADGLFLECKAPDAPAALGAGSPAPAVPPRPARPPVTAPAASAGPPPPTARPPE